MSVILPLIEDAIDVRLMDVKNISKLIYSYIEYEQFEGKEYNCCARFMLEGEHYTIFIHKGKFLTVKDTQNVWFLAEDGGIIINGYGYVVLGDTIEFAKEMVKKTKNKQIIVFTEYKSVVCGFNLGGLNLKLEDKLLDASFEMFLASWIRYLDL